MLIFFISVLIKEHILVINRHFKHVDNVESAVELQNYVSGQGYIANTVEPQEDDINEYPTLLVGPK